MNSVRITARSPGFRRAGLAHPAEAVEHPAERFTPEQLAQLLEERELVVELLADGRPLAADQVAAVRGELERFLAGEARPAGDPIPAPEGDPAPAEKPKPAGPKPAGRKGKA